MDSDQPTQTCPQCRAEAPGAAAACPACQALLGTRVAAPPTVVERDPMANAETVVAIRRDWLGGRYRILKPLGEGAFGRVDLAFDQHLEMQVAVKRLKAGGAETEATRRIRLRFKKEATTIAAFDHPNIVRITDYDCHADEFFIVMEYIDGPSLDAYLEEQGRLPVAEAVRLVSAVAEGLDYAHRNDLIHRDIKPSNIMLARRGDEWVPKLVDFGLARTNKDMGLSKTGMVAGTPDYMPDEQRRDSKNVNHTVDLFALGKVLYVLVTGEGPGTLNSQKIPPPAELARIIFKCVETNPADRYFSARELIEDLGALTSSQFQPADTRALMQHNICPKCQQPNEKGDRFCATPGCGTPLTRRCPECDRENTVHRDICAQCGTDIEVFLKIRELRRRAERADQRKDWQKILDDYQLLPADVRAGGDRGREMLEVIETLRRQAEEQLARARELVEAAQGREEDEHFLEAAELYAQARAITPGNSSLDGRSAECRYRDVSRRLADGLQRLNDLFGRNRLQTCRQEADALLADIADYQPPDDATWAPDYDVQYAELGALIERLAAREQSTGRLLEEARGAFEQQDYLACRDRAQHALALDAQSAPAAELAEKARRRLQSLASKWERCQEYRQRRKWKNVIIMCDRILALQSTRGEAARVKRTAQRAIVRARWIRGAIAAAAVVTVVVALAVTSADYRPAALDRYFLRREFAAALTRGETAVRARSWSDSAGALPAMEMWSDTRTRQLIDDPELQARARQLTDAVRQRLRDAERRLEKDVAADVAADTPGLAAFRGQLNAVRQALASNDFSTALSTLTAADDGAGELRAAARRQAAEAAAARRRFEAETAVAHVRELAPYVPDGLAEMQAAAEAARQAAAAGRHAEATARYHEARATLRLLPAIAAARRRFDAAMTAAEQALPTADQVTDAGPEAFAAAAAQLQALRRTPSTARIDETRAQRLETALTNLAAARTRARAARRVQAEARLETALKTVEALHVEARNAQERRDKHYAAGEYDYPGNHEDYHACAQALADALAALDALALPETGSPWAAAITAQRDQARRQTLDLWQELLPAPTQRLRHELGPVAVGRHDDLAAAAANLTRSEEEWKQGRLRRAAAALWDADEALRRMHAEAAAAIRRQRQAYVAAEAELARTLDAQRGLLTTYATESWARLVGCRTHVRELGHAGRFAAAITAATEARAALLAAVKEAQVERRDAKERLDAAQRRVAAAETAQRDLIDRYATAVEKQRLAALRHAVDTALAAENYPAATAACRQLADALVKAGGVATERHAAFAAVEQLNHTMAAVEDAFAAGRREAAAAQLKEANMAVAHFVLPSACAGTAAADRLAAVRQRGQRLQRQVAAAGALLARAAEALAHAGNAAAMPGGPGGAVKRGLAWVDEIGAAAPVGVRDGWRARLYEMQLRWLLGRMSAAGARRDLRGWVLMALRQWPALDVGGLRKKLAAVAPPAAAARWRTCSLRRELLPVGMRLPTAAARAVAGEGAGAGGDWARLLPAWVEVAVGRPGGVDELPAMLQFVLVPPAADTGELLYVARRPVLRELADKTRRRDLPGVRWAPELGMDYVFAGRVAATASLAAGLAPAELSMVCATETPRTSRVHHWTCLPERPGFRLPSVAEWRRACAWQPGTDWQRVLGAAAPVPEQGETDGEYFVLLPSGILVFRRPDLRELTADRSSLRKDADGLRAARVRDPWRVVSDDAVRESVVAIGVGGGRNDIRVEELDPRASHRHVGCRLVLPVHIRMPQ